jgi:hypothetical protein
LEAGFQGMCNLTRIRAVENVVVHIVLNAIQIAKQGLHMEYISLTFSTLQHFNFSTPQFSSNFVPYL